MLGEWWKRPPPFLHRTCGRETRGKRAALTKRKVHGHQDATRGAHTNARRVLFSFFPFFFDLFLLCYSFLSFSPSFFFLFRFFLFFCVFTFFLFCNDWNFRVQKCSSGEENPSIRRQRRFVSRGAGGRVTTNVLLRDLDLEIRKDRCQTI